MQRSGGNEYNRQPRTHAPASPHYLTSARCSGGRVKVRSEGNALKPVAPQSQSLSASGGELLLLLLDAWLDRAQFRHARARSRAQYARSPY